MLAAGWLLFPALLYTSTPQPAQFSHQAHGEAAGLTCDTCHGFTAEGRFAGIPTTESCAGCHSGLLGETESEKHFFANFVEPGREVNWLIYSRQPDNVRFSHARHVQVGKMECAECHGPHGESESLKAFERNRISGYSRDIWGPRMLRVGLKPGQGMKMDDCMACHRDRQVEAGCLGCHR